MTRSFRSLGALLLLSLLLAACTGTGSPVTPRLLFVTHQPAGGSGWEAVLVVDNGTAVDPRLEYVADTAFALPGEPVAADVTDRAGGRTEVMLLLEASGDDYLLQRFATPDEPVDSLTQLAPTGPAISVRDFLTDAVNGDVTPAELCPQHLQVSRDGRTVVLLNHPESCGSSLERPEILVLDLESGEALSVGGSEAMLEGPVPVIVDQDSDTLYFAVTGTGDVAMDVRSLDDVTVAPPPGSNRVFTDSGQEGHVDMALLADSMVLLSRTGLYSLPLSGSGSSTAVPESGATGLVKDPYGQAGFVAVLRSGRLAVHQTPATPVVETRDVLSLSGTVPPGRATFDSQHYYVYVLHQERIQVADLLDFTAEPEASGTRGSVTSVRIDELGTPGTITWLPAIPPEPVTGP